MTKSEFETSTGASFFWLVQGILSLALAGTGCGPEGQGLDQTDSVESAAEQWHSQTLSPAIESAHPYANNTSVERRIEAPATATQVRVQVEVKTEQGYDFVHFLSESGVEAQRFSGNGSGWTQAIDGNVVIVRFDSDYSVTDWGFKITAIEYTEGSGGGTAGGNWTEVATSQIETPHPYRNNMDQTWTVIAPAGTTAMRVSFSSFDTESGYDFLTIYDSAQNAVQRLDGAKGAFVTPSISTDRLDLRFTSDGSVTRQGFVVAKVEAQGGSGGGGGCSSNSDCASGETCEQVQCVRAPCPRLCVPVSGNGPASAEACSSSNSCSSGLSCRAEQNSSSKVCVEPVWSVRPLDFPQSTSHPYGNNEQKSFDVSAPEWATSMKVVFDNFATESGYDVALVRVDGATVDRYTGSLGNFSSAELNGSSAEVVFTSDQSVTGYGFDLSSVETYGIPSRLVAVSLDPRQCNSDRVPTDPAGLVRHLESIGVAVYGIRSYVFSTNVCRACSCPTGDRLVIVVDAKDVFEVMDLSRNTGIFSVQADDNLYAGRLVELSTAPVQCMGNEWDQYCSSHSCGSGIEARVKAWASSLGVDVYTLFEQRSAQAVCSACSCPTGVNLHIGVPENQASTLEAHGFLRR